MKLCEPWEILFEGNRPAGLVLKDEQKIRELVQSEINLKLKDVTELAESLETMISNEYERSAILVGTFDCQPTDSMITSAIAEFSDIEYDNILEIRVTFREKSAEEVDEAYYRGEEEVSEVEYNVTIITLMKPLSPEECVTIEDQNFDILDDIRDDLDLELPEIDIEEGIDSDLNY